MKNYKNRFAILLVFFFFTHGILYFFTGDIYSSDNPVKLVKYALLLVFIFGFPCAWWRINSGQFLVVSFFLYISFVLILYVFTGIDIYYVLMFLIPLVFFFIPRVITYNDFIRVLKYTLFSSLCFAIIEICFLRELSLRFSSTGFRGVSIFVNPNNFGILVTLVLALLVSSEEGRPKKNKVIFFGSAAVCVTLSGSMTAAIIYLYILMTSIFIIIKNSLSSMKVSFFSVIFVPFYLAVIFIMPDVNFGVPLRNADVVGTDNVSARVNYLNHFFFVAADNIAYPLFGGSEIYVDNAFIYTWIMLGFIGFAMYFFLLILMIMTAASKPKIRHLLVFFCSFSLAAMTTNVFNIWPIAYLYWAVVGFGASIGNVYKKDNVQYET